MEFDRAATHRLSLLGRDRFKVRFAAGSEPSFTVPPSPLRALMHRSKFRLYSITSSARTRNAGGMVMPSVLAVFKLIRNSNLEGC